MSKNNKKGFTIIEVVLVLAIAGLIFLMVFIALPALQRSQRNTQRRNDLARFVTAVNQYQSNNRGRLPEETNAATAEAGWITDYIGASGSDQYTDPEGNAYTYIGYAAYDASSKNTTAVDAVSEWELIGGGICGIEGGIEDGNGSRHFAIYMQLEGGQVACNDNQ